MKKLNKKYIIVILIVVVAFLLPFFVQNDNSVSYAVGENCSANGRAGVCRTRGTTVCNTYYHSGACPGGTNNQCCINSQVACNPPGTAGGYCHNFSGGNTYNCAGLGGTWYSNYCPGTPADVRCCVLPTPTNTPTPTRTPTPTPTNTPTPTPTPAPSGKGSTTTPGIIFSGDWPADFGSGQPSEEGWVVGGSEYPEVFSQSTNPNSLAHQRLFDKATRAKLPINDMTDHPGCASLDNCNLSGITHGIYRANGDVTLRANTFLANNNYVFLIDGDLTITGNIIAPTGSMVLFTSSNDIIINRTVGAVANTFPLPSAQVQALFIADHDFIVDGIGNCGTGTDRMLNIEGAIVANAGKTGGSFRNLRDLCTFNATIPAVTISPRLDFLLNAPEFIMTTSTTFREIL